MLDSPSEVQFLESAEEAMASPSVERAPSVDWEGQAYRLAEQQAEQWAWKVIRT